MITKHKLCQTKKTSQKDFNIVVSEFMKLIGDQYFEKGSMQAVSEFCNALGEDHENLVNLPFKESKGNLLPKRTLSKVKDVKRVLGQDYEGQRHCPGKGLPRHERREEAADRL